MAACDTGYICDVCGKDVEAITESDLYLRYVMGEVSPLALPKQRERHIRCNPAVAQYIVDPAFEPVICGGMFAKANLDADFVRDQETLVTRASAPGCKSCRDVGADDPGVSVAGGVGEVAKVVAHQIGLKRVMPGTRSKSASLLAKFVRPVGLHHGDD